MFCFIIKKIKKDSASQAHTAELSGMLDLVCG